MTEDAFAATGRTPALSGIGQAHCSNIILFAASLTIELLFTRTTKVRPVTTLADTGFDERRNHVVAVIYWRTRSHGSTA
jgi:hypothetical protein